MFRSFYSYVQDYINREFKTYLTKIQFVYEEHLLPPFNKM